MRCDISHFPHLSGCRKLEQADNSAAGGSALNALATPEAAIRNVRSPRLRLLVWPREHGAWGMLLIPLLTGALAGVTRPGAGPQLLMLLLAALTLFCLRTPCETLLGTTPLRARTPAERRGVMMVLVGFAAMAGLALANLLWAGRNRGLLALGAAAALLLVLQAGVKQLGRTGRMPAQLLGALALTATAPAAYYLATGSFDRRALALWFANWMFSGNQIHFVQLRIHGARLRHWGEKYALGRGFFLGQFLLLIVLTLAGHSGWLPALAILAFVPAVARGVRWFFGGAHSLAVHRLGFSELAHALVFGALLVLAFRLSL